MLLTLAIPTFKRPELLYKNLIHIFQQTAGRIDVDVFVADDSDGSDNAVWIERARSKFPTAQLKYTVNPQNLGIDENIKHCLFTPTSDYVWLLGEDDLLADDAVAKVVAALTAHWPVFLFANYIYCDDNHERFADRPVLREAAGVCLLPFESFASESIWALGFIGGCVIRTEDWRRQAVDRYVGSYYSHVGGIIDAALGESICVVGDILVLNRAEDVNTFTWSRSTFDVYFSFYRVLSSSRLSERPDLLLACQRAAARLFAVFSLPWLAAKRADGLYDVVTYRKYYAACLGRSWIWHAGARLIAYFPRAPLSTLRRFHLKNRFSRNSL